MGLLTRGRRLFHTVRYLRPGQIGWRLWYRVVRPRPRVKLAPPSLGASEAWVPPIAKPQSQEGEASFRFLNQVREVRTATDWNDPSRDKLWLYNLHYFDDLNSEGAAERLEWHASLIERWITENLPGHGNGWEPYPTSLRIVNWVKWLLAGHSPTPAMEASLANQVRWLARRLEHHILGNHLLANAKALIFAGQYFQGAEAEGWRRRGGRLLERQVDEQVLADGGHFERSPMYHHIVLEDLLDIANVLQSRGGEIPDYLSRAIEEMAKWAEVMSHPDGDIAFFNDATFGIVPGKGPLESYASRLGLDWPERALGSRLLAASGYARLEYGPWVALVDVAPVGPDYLPGHAHADTLSLELSVSGRRVLVNTGISEYGTGPERSRQRGTAAHNTVCLDGEDSSEVWAGFRVARRARVHDLRFDGDGARVEAWHDGYRRLPGKPCHWRSVQLGESGLDIVDRVEGRGEHHAKGFFMFHPDVQVAALDEADGFRVELWGCEPMKLWVAGADSVWLEDGVAWHPEFGCSLNTRRVVYEVRGVPPFDVQTRLVAS